MFNAHTFDNSSSAGAAFMEIVQGRDEDDSQGVSFPQPLFMPLRRSHLTGSITGPLARMTLEHEFGHPDGSDGPVLEAVYRFPLPGDAAVTGIHVQFGQVEIHAELAERHSAELEYDEARATGRQAVLLTRESPDVFSLHVSGIEAGEPILIRTEYVQLARSADQGFSLRIPLTPAPRYTSLDGHGGRHEHGQPLALALDPGHRFSLDLLLRGVESLVSPTHELEIREENEGTRISLRSGEVVPDRDLFMKWSLPREKERLSFHALRYRDEGSPEHEYFLTLVTPPAHPEPAREHPREIVLLVDRSGSMHGAKWQAADWAVRRFLSGLQPYDSFTVGLFHSETRWFARQCLSATEANVKAAQRFVDEHGDSGGTELESALVEALESGRARGLRSRHVVILTDAQVTNSSRILEIARNESRNEDRRRISVLCIDAAPNSHLVHELVAIGGGRASFLTSNPEHDDITTALDEILSFWDEPVETDLRLSVDRPDVWVMGRPATDEDTFPADVSRIDIGDMPAGRPVWVVGRAPASDAPMNFQLERAGEVIATAGEPGDGDESIKLLFGARRLLALESQLEIARSGRSSRRAVDSSHEKLRQLIVAESLHYGLACAETAFVAVRQEAGKLVQRGAVVPNALPYGWADMNVVYSMAPPTREAVGDMWANAPMDDYPAPASRAFRSASRRRIEPEQLRKSPMDRTGGLITLFSGVPPVPVGDRVILYELDSFGRTGRLIALSVSIDGEDDGIFDGELALYAGGDAQPRARVRLRDVLSLGGTRPLNIRVLRHFDIRLELRDVVCAERVPGLKIELTWI